MTRPTPAELFERPSHTFVGYFIGSPGMNVMPARLDGAAAVIGEHRIPLPSAPATDGKSVELGIRPEYIRIGTEGMPVTVTKFEDIGRHRILRADLDGNEIAVIVPDDPRMRALSQRLKEFRFRRK